MTTPYLQSFDTAIAPEASAESTSTKNRLSQSPDPSATGPQTQKSEHLNFFLTKPELDSGVQRSQWLSTPPEIAQKQASPHDYTSDTSPEQRLAYQKAEQETASEALRRISSLSLGSSSDRLRLNKQRCIIDFGRHNTDSSLAPRPSSIVPSPVSQLPKTPRVGPDTGSSEVQIAILTAKIRTLADFLGTRGRMDKANKRNLRLLVHRRQKLLQYLRKKERGGPRFQNVVNTLGLTEGTWRGEISL